MPFVQHDTYLSHPDTWRGVCAFCGSAQRTLEGRPEQVWDTGLKIDDSDGIYGGVFICESCVRELAADAGMVNEGQAVELQAEANDLRAANAALQTDVDDLTKLVESLRVYNDRNPQDPAVISQPATAASPANAVGEPPAPGAPDQTADQSPNASGDTPPVPNPADAASTIPSGNVPTTATKADENVPSAGDANPPESEATPTA